MISKHSFHSGLARISLAVVFLSVIFTISGCSSLSETSPENKYAIEINSCLVRDRVIPLGQLIMRSMMIVGFKIIPTMENISDMTIRGELYIDNKLFSEDSIVKPDSSGNNMGFDIPLSEGTFSHDQPLSIPAGRYRIVIKLFDEKKNLMAQTEKKLERNQIGRTFYGFDKTYNQPGYVLINNEETDRGSMPSRFEAVSSEKTKATNYTTVKTSDYVVFQKSYLERVYPNTEPKEDELITEIAAKISRNETKPLTFSIRANEDLGMVSILISALKNKQGRDSGISVDVGVVNQLTEVVRKDNDKNLVYYRYAPRIIEYKKEAIPQNRTQTYWLTLKTTSHTIPGNYYGTMKMQPQAGKETEMPVHVEVLPLTLTDTDKQYGMMMDYAFYELDNDRWTAQERKLIQKSGAEIYKDLRDHGITVIYPHSHCFMKYGMNGEPILNGLKASLESYKNLQFPGPFVWYLGHLLQTAKSMHPGSIINYDAEVSKKRLTDLLARFENMAKELRIPKDALIVQLVDEPDYDQKGRTKAGKALHEFAKEIGFKTLITRPWTDVDVICTGTPDNENQAKQFRSMAKEWWIYPNAALSGKNLSFTRYVFGFGAWRWGVDGVVPWTYQMSQGSNGNPFTVLDGSETMVAYPGAAGSDQTPLWEAIRDGINDYKYIYLLEKLIREAKAKGNPSAAAIEGKLLQLKNTLGKNPRAAESEYGNWTPDFFDKKRNQIITLLLDKKLSIDANL